MEPKEVIKTASVVGLLSFIVGMILCLGGLEMVSLTFFVFGLCFVMFASMMQNSFSYEITAGWLLIILVSVLIAGMSTILPLSLSTHHTVTEEFVPDDTTRSDNGNLTYVTFGDWYASTDAGRIWQISNEDLVVQTSQDINWYGLNVNELRYFLKERSVELDNTDELE